MIVLLIVGIVIALLCALPVGIVAIYDVSGSKVALKIGFLRFQIVPKKQKRKPKVKSKKKKEKSDEEPRGGKWTDFLPIARTVIELFNELRLRVKVKDFTFKLTMAGDDPCDLGTNYGRTWAAASALQPHLDRLFNIKKQRVDINCDYCAETTKVYCRVIATISLLRFTRILIHYGLRIYKEYTELKNHKKGGTVYESETSSNA